MDKSATLEDLSKNFLTVLESSPDGAVDLNLAAQLLKADKRRICDVANIMEGTGLIERTSINHVRWRTDRAPISQTIVNGLVRKEAELDRLLESANSAIRRLTTSCEAEKYGYITERDVYQINSLRDQTIVAIKAPPHTTLAIPDPGQKILMYFQTPGIPLQTWWFRKRRPDAKEIQKETREKKTMHMAAALPLQMRQHDAQLESENKLHNLQAPQEQDLSFKASSIDALSVTRRKQTERNARDSFNCESQLNSSALEPRSSTSLVKDKHVDNCSQSTDSISTLLEEIGELLHPLSPALTEQDFTLYLDKHNKYPTFTT